MKVFRLLSLFFAAVILLFAPTAAFGAYGGVGGSVTVTPPAPSGDGCYTSTVVVQGDPDDTTLTLTVRDSSGAVVFTQSKPAGSDGTATFTVRLCTPGDFTGTGTNQDGDVLGTVQTTVPGSGSQGGGASGGSGSSPSTGSTGGSGSGSAGSTSGGLPATGFGAGSTMILGGGLALLLAGGAALVVSRRKALI